MKQISLYVCLELVSCMCKLGYVQKPFHTLLPVCNRIPRAAHILIIIAVLLL